MSIELGVLQYSDLNHRVQQCFTLCMPGCQLELQLTEVKKLSLLPSGFSRTHAFSITFRGPLETPLGQGCVDLEHPELGRLENVFIVPVEKRPEGYLYEAVFG